MVEDGNPKDIHDIRNVSATENCNAKNHFTQLSSNRLQLCQSRPARSSVHTLGLHVHVELPDMKHVQSRLDER